SRRTPSAHRLSSCRSSQCAKFVRYTSGTTNIQTKSTKCQYNPVFSTYPADSRPLEYILDTTNIAITPQMTCSRCSPVIVKKVCPNKPELSVILRPNSSNHSRRCSPANSAPSTIVE